jgi:hypothetical protein
MPLARTILLGCALALAGAACTPNLNWREIQPEGSELFAMFPCKPERFARRLVLAGETVEMRMVSCVVDGVTYAVAHAGVQDPAKINPALGELQAAAVRNLGGTATEAAVPAINGMTPNDLAKRIDVTGRGTDGAVVQEQAVFFVKGLRVYQASMVGPKLDAEATETFLAGLRFAS